MSNRKLTPAEAAEERMNRHRREEAYDESGRGRSYDQRTPSGYDGRSSTGRQNDRSRSRERSRDRSKTVRYKDSLDLALESTIVAKEDIRENRVKVDEKFVLKASKFHDEALSTLVTAISAFSASSASTLNVEENSRALGYQRTFMNLKNELIKLSKALESAKTMKDQIILTVQIDETTKNMITAKAKFREITGNDMRTFGGGSKRIRKRMNKTKRRAANKDK